MIPIYKKGNAELAENYRPTSLLPVFSKVVEAALKNRITDHFERNGLFSASQYGFRSGRSTTDAIAEFVDDVVECFENGEYMMTTFCDLSKAFDCVQHKLLIAKLQKYNFDTRSCKLIESYFSKRSQVVKFNDDISDRHCITVGVAQGSILGAIFFLIYINDLPLNISHASVINYADDTTLLTTSKNYDDAMEMSTAARMCAEDWFRSNMLRLNPDKTVLALFTLRRNLNHSMQDDPIKFLGILVDRTLTWEAHVASTCSRLGSSIFGLRVLSASVSSHMLRTAYYAFCQPIMTYGLLVWGGAATWPDIFRMQRRAVRIIDQLDYRADCRDSFIRLRILTFPSLFILECVLYVQKNLDSFTTHADLHNYHTRHKNNLKPRYCRLSKSQKSVNCVSVRFYNRLPMSVRTLPLQKFKTAMKNFLMEKAFYSYNEFLDCHIAPECF